MNGTKAGTALEGLPVIIIMFVIGCPGAASTPPTTTTPATTTTKTLTTTGTLTITSATTTTATITTTTATATTTGTGPAVYLIEPTPGGNEFVNNITITVNVSNFALADKTGQANVPGEGHLIYYLDVTIPTTAGQPALTAQGSYAVSAGTSYLLGQSVLSRAARAGRAVGEQRYYGARSRGYRAGRDERQQLARTRPCERVCSHDEPTINKEVP